MSDNGPAAFDRKERRVQVQAPAKLCRLSWVPLWQRFSQYVLRDWTAINHACQSKHIRSHEVTMLGKYAKFEMTRRRSHADRYDASFLFVRDRFTVLGMIRQGSHTDGNAPWILFIWAWCGDVDASKWRCTKWLVILRLDDAHSVCDCVGVPIVKRLDREASQVGRSYGILMVCSCLWWCRGAYFEKAQRNFCANKRKECWSCLFWASQTGMPALDTSQRFLEYSMLCNLCLYQPIRKYSCLSVKKNCNRVQKKFFLAHWCAPRHKRSAKLDEERCDHCFCSCMLALCARVTA